jgi:DNA-binding CsgD family transcriptional regulator
MPGRDRTAAHARAEAALEVIGIVDECRELEAFPGVVLDALGAAIPYDVASYNEVDPRIPRITEVSRPVGTTYPPDIVERWLELRDEHPLYTHHARTGDGSALRISDLMSDADYRALPIYTDVYRFLDVQYQMSCALPSAEPVVVALALSRSGRDFTDRERGLLELLRPHLARMYERSRYQTLLRQALEAVASGGTFHALAICDGAHVQPLNGRAAGIVERWFAHDSAASQELVTWLGRQRAGDVYALPTGEAEPVSMVLRDDDLQLTVRFVPGNDGPDVLLLGELPRHVTPALEALGLRRREAEVLLLAADGVDNGEIASRLGISVGTVRKHLERIYTALGVSTRAGAVSALYKLRAALVQDDAG